jgi:hypothetical protein
LSRASADLLWPHQVDAAQAITVAENFLDHSEVAGHPHLAAKRFGEEPLVTLASSLEGARLPHTDAASEADTACRDRVRSRDDFAAPLTLNFFHGWVASTTSSRADSAVMDALAAPMDVLVDA